MRHLKSFKMLNRRHAHRRALYRNMVEALFKRERIKTTVIKAKEIRRVAEKIITKAKVKNLHNIRIVSRLLKDKKILSKLFNEIAPRYINRNGGYTRVIKLSRRLGDGAPMAYLELLGEQIAVKKKKKTGEGVKKENVTEINKVKTAVEEKKEEKKEEVKENAPKKESAKVKEEKKVQVKEGTKRKEEAKKTEETKEKK